MSNTLLQLSVLLIPLAGLYFIYRLIFRGFRAQDSERQPSSLMSPTQMLRGRGGPFQYSPRPSWAIWLAYALAMTLAAEIVMNATTVLSGIATDADGTPTTQAIVMLMVIVACALAAIMALPGGSRSRVLDVLNVFLAIGAFLIDPWIGGFLQLVLIWILLGIPGTLGALLQAGAVLGSWWIISLDQGTEMLTLTIALTLVFGTLTMLLVVLTRAVGAAVTFSILFVLAVTVAAAAPIR